MAFNPWNQMKERMNIKGGVVVEWLMFPAGTYAIGQLEEEAWNALPKAIQSLFEQCKESIPHIQATFEGRQIAVWFDLDTKVRYVVVPEVLFLNPETVEEVEVFTQPFEARWDNTFQIRYDE